MRKFVWASVAIGTLAIANPTFAQDNAAEPETEVATQDRMDELAGMMSGLFQTEPLTGEQLARLPAAQTVVGKMMPDGFYSKMMGDMMDKMLRPMMSSIAGPGLFLGTRLEVNKETLDGLAEAEQIEIVNMLDPAYDQRIDVIVSVLTGKMGGMFSAMEGPMREGLSKAYAVRFDDAQLGDIAAFFSTPTGAVYAKESMALFADPQVMQASMQALPAMMSGFGDVETAMKDAMADLPTERQYADLTPEQRARLAALLDVDADSLADIVKPSKSMDASHDDHDM